MEKDYNLREHNSFPPSRKGSSCVYMDDKRHQFNIIKDTGVVLRCYGEYSNSRISRVACVIKLISIVVGGLPAVSDLKVPVALNHGKAYSNMFIKSLMMYKNGNLKIIFNAPGDLEKFLQALLSEV